MYQASLGPFRLNHDPVKEGATADQFLFTDQKTGSQKGASPSRGHMARNGSLERAQQQGCRRPQLCGSRHWIPAPCGVSVCAEYKPMGTSEKQSFGAGGAVWV